MRLLERANLALPLSDKWARVLAGPLPAALLMIGGIALAVAWRLPDSTAYIDTCRKSTAQAHPGEVRLVSSHILDGATRIKLHITQPDGRELVAVCDGPSGKILRLFRIDEN